MAKQRKVLPARKTRDEESMLIRSAESLGRMIGSLQRQLDDAARNLPRGLDGDATTRRDGNGQRLTNGNAARMAKKATRADGVAKSSTTKAHSTTDRSSKRASKSDTDRLSPRRTRSGASSKARKAARHA